MHETLRKLCLSIKFPDQKIKGKFILRSAILQNPSRRLLLREVYMSLTCTQFFYLLILIFNNKSQGVKPLAIGHKITILTEWERMRACSKICKSSYSRCSIEKVFLEISQNLQESTCEFCEISKNTSWKTFGGCF